MTTKMFSEQSILQLPQRVRANFINSLSGFKSANLVGTTSLEGVHNLAMISSAFHVGANPPLLGILMRPHTVVRDTLANIKNTGVFTLNHVTKDFVAQAHQCSARYEPEVSEFNATGLQVQMASAVKAPYVAEAKIKMALHVEQITKIELNDTELVIGRIVEVSIPNDSLLNDGFVDIEKSGSVAVSCLDSYHVTTRLDRFSYAKADQPLTSIWTNNNDPES